MLLNLSAEIWFKPVGGQIRCFLGEVDITEIMLEAEHLCPLSFDFDVEVKDDCLKIKLEGVEVTNEFSKIERGIIQDEIRTAKESEYSDYDK